MIIPGAGPAMSLAEGAAALRDIADRLETGRLPADAHLVKNDVGNLTIVTPDGTYLGWCDLYCGTVRIFAETPY